MDRPSLQSQLIRSGVLKSPAIVQAFEQINRADFVLPESRAVAYEDHPLTIGYGQTISQPTTVAFMLELLEPGAGQKILDVGSGSGWSTALLATVVGERGLVIGTELIPELVQFGRQNLKRYRFNWASIEPAGGELGWPKAAPYDRILVSAAARELPTALVEQLATGGRLVVPIEHTIHRIQKKSTTEVVQEAYPGFVFVPLVEKSAVSHKR